MTSPSDDVPAAVRPPTGAPAKSFDVILLNGADLGCAEVVRLADGTARATLSPAALEQMELSHATAVHLAATRDVYGRTTGVGGKGGVRFTEPEIPGHGMRLLRSHASGAGRPLPARQVRAMLAIRANQLLAGGAGVDPQVVRALVAALNSGAHPVVREYGAVGCGDLTALAELGLALTGEHPWEGTLSLPAIVLDDDDALALMSSNALVLGRSALILDDVRRLLHAAHAIAALCLVAVDASMEPYAGAVHDAAPHPGAVRSAATMRRLLGVTSRPGPPAGRVQDPFAFRCLPQVYGAALGAADSVEQALTVELNAGVENPLISVGEHTLYHHGGFFTAQITLVLDQLRLAIFKVAQLSNALLTALFEPALTGLGPFLAEDGGSGVMLLGHTAADALSDVQAAAFPASLGHAVLCRGTEELASFASLAVRQGLHAVEGLRLVLACELVAAVRALRQRGTPPPTGTEAAHAFKLANAALDERMADRPLTGDIETATKLVDRLGQQ
ncbi:aromatic amino acid ammonia-lyase [Kitasatospora sp. NPDC101235]|uniref:aromatic amino acid ammonia-lyase n=1 Tax=Kitasatospora sp. NPDC101235 TaxID=3364101 RepID=UPI00381459FB